MQLLAKEIKCLRVMLAFLLLSPLFYKVVVAPPAPPTPAQVCGLIDVPRDPSLPVCCGKSLGPLGNTRMLVEEFLGLHPDDLETKNNLHKYFWDEVQAGHPRVFPLCVTTNNSAVTHSKYVKFGQLMNGIYKDFRTATGQRFYKFDPETDLMSNSDSWVERIQLSRINGMFSDMVNMRQWFHIRIKMKSAMQGLLLDHVVGPLGIPQGEFNLQFTCSDNPPDGSGATEMQKDAFLIYCDFRPKALPHHPTVYFGLGSGRTEFHVHFRYTQVSCLLTRYLQFIVIPVKSFSSEMVKGVDYQMQLSKVFKMKEAFDSEDGFAYPLYQTHQWRNYHYCYLTSQSQVVERLKKVEPIAQEESTKPTADGHFADITWGETDELQRILPNYEFEHCLLKELDEGRDDTRYECPPGPFNCDQNLRELSDNEILANQKLWLELENKNTPCEEKCALSGDVVPLGLDEEKVNLHNAWESAKDARFHGLVESLAYFVLIPIANLMGRFYKENPKRVCCNMQFWIFAHVVLHMLAMVVSWIALAMVGTGSTINSVHPECGDPFTSGSSECFAMNAKSQSHVGISSIAVIVHHVDFVTGCCRSQKDWFRKIQVLLHSVGGYATSVLCLIALSLVNPVCSLETIIFLALYVVIYIFAFVFLTIFECKIDSLLGVSPKRSIFPILEGIIVDPAQIPGSFKKLQVAKKLIILGSSVALGLVWFLDLSSVMALKFNVEDYVRQGRVADIPGALLGPCENVNKIFEHYKA
ncbi:unnamed protein product [Orchesella dallaii]|uniref:Uncharacterized protein n=1 Tax=Orchesella dallaii TaxID=48710 RepID=A0ABP1QGZ0_9HEXA